MVIVDTSVWVAYFRGTASPVDDIVDGLLDSDEAVVLGPVMFELLRGSRSAREYGYLSDRLKQLPFEDTNMTIWARAAHLTYELRTHGVTVGMPDAVIAAIALESDHQVFSLDSDFQRIPGLKLFNPLETNS